MDIRSTVTLLSGNKMPIMGIGSWQLTHNTADVVAESLRIGYPLIDTSGDYGTQPAIGEGIAKSGKRRGEFYLVTKVEEVGDAYATTQDNLDELELDYADLVLIHRPPSSDAASRELWEGLIHARSDGLTKDIGVSNYTIDQMQYLISATGEIPVVNQIEWTPFGHSQEMLEFCKSQGIIIQAYSPLTRGTRLDDSILQSIADKYRKTPAQILIRWNLQLGTVPIPKANQPEHIKSNLNVFDFEIDPDDMATLNGLNEAYSALGSLPYA